MSTSTERVSLLNNVTTSGSAVTVDGGRYIVDAVCATWNGATAQLQYLSADNATYVNVNGASFVANGAAEIMVGAGALMKMTISGTPSAGVYAALKRVPGV